MGSASYFQWFYFSLRGRTGRQAYWLFAILPAFLLGVALGIINFAVHVPERAFLVFILAVAPLLVWSGIAVSVKRLHDIGISGWWTIPCFVPYVSYIAVIVLGLIRGQAGKNAYGEDTHRRKVVTL
jgi:uncharacterized membrane protein YhaH (DUF805 family)